MQKRDLEKRPKMEKDENEMQKRIKEKDLRDLKNGFFS